MAKVLNCGLGFFLTIFLFCGCVPPDIKPAPIQDPAYLEAERYFLEGDFSKAQELLTRYIRKNPVSRTFLLRGKCYLLTGDYHRAVLDFTEGIDRAAVKQELVEGYLGLADSYYSNREYTKSVKYYRLLLDEYPFNIPRDIVMLRYSHSLLRLEKWDEGREMLVTLEYEFPDSPLLKEAGELRRSAQGSYYIQVGIFSRRDNAVNVNQTLLQRGFIPSIMEERGRYAVIVAYFEHIDEAKEMLDRVKEAGYSDAYIKP